MNTPTPKPIRSFEVHHGASDSAVILVLEDGPYTHRDVVCTCENVAEGDDTAAKRAERITACLTACEELADPSTVPALLAELRETVDWLHERAEALEQLAAGFSGQPTSISGQRRQALRDEAAKLRGRAALIRQTAIHKAARGT